MKTTEMIAKVKEANNVTILSVRGLPIGWDSMRDLGHTLYVLVDMVKEDSGIYRLFEKADGALVLAPTAQADIVGPYKISYPLEFDSFGELENWSHVSEEDATALLTKAPVELPQEKQGVDLFKRVFDLVDVDSAMFVHKTQDRFVNIDFNKGLVQVGHEGNSEPPRKLKITLVDATPDATPYHKTSEVPDFRTGHEVKAS
jgi:hypothetical protein